MHLQTLVFFSIHWDFKMVLSFQIEQLKIKLCCKLKLWPLEWKFCFDLSTNMTILKLSIDISAWIHYKLSTTTTSPNKKCRHFCFSSWIGNRKRFVQIDFSTSIFRREKCSLKIRSRFRNTFAHWNMINRLMEWMRRRVQRQSTFYWFHPPQ